jgi:hypothetical protein
MILPAILRHIFGLFLICPEVAAGNKPNVTALNRRWQQRKGSRSARHAPFSDSGYNQ